MCHARCGLSEHYRSRPSRHNPHQHRLPRHSCRTTITTFESACLWVVSKFQPLVRRIPSLIDISSHMCDPKDARSGCSPKRSDVTMVASLPAPAWSVEQTWCDLCPLASISAAASDSHPRPGHGEMQSGKTFLLSESGDLGSFTRVAMAYPDPFCHGSGPQQSPWSPPTARGRGGSVEESGFEPNAAHRTFVGQPHGISRRGPYLQFLPRSVYALALARKPTSLHGPQWSGFQRAALNLGQSRDAFHRFTVQKVQGSTWPEKKKKTTLGSS